MTKLGRTRAVSERPTVMVVDDAEAIRTYLKNLLPLHGYEVVLAEDGEKAIALLEGNAEPDVIILDVMMPRIDGLETLMRIKQTHATIPVIMLSVVGKASTIVDAINLGAADYINKPFEEEELEIAIQKVLETQSLKAERDGLRQLLHEAEERERTSFLWASEKMMRIHDTLEQVADADVTVLIHGESGAGKEVVARTLHELSNRREKRFVKVNCAALPEELLESELFGYERGAFTGAASRKLGKFEQADHGAMFLDEIGEMSAPLQAKLLQVLQDGEFSRLGGHDDVRVDVRVVAATNRDLEEMVARGTFREDLYYRLNVVNVRVPPLRERAEEIPVLTEYFLHQCAQKYHREATPISDALLQGFLAYSWPGNVRELENMVKRIVVLGNEEVIADEIFGTSGSPLAPKTKVATPAEIVDQAEAAGEDLSLRDIGRRAAREAEREALSRVLYQTNWNRKKAASILGVSYKTLLQKIKECGLSA